MLPINASVLATIVQSVDDATLRKQAFVISQRHSPQALKLLDHLLMKRHELAAILQFPSFAALSLTNRLAKTPGKVHSFLNNLSTLVKPKADLVIAA